METVKYPEHEKVGKVKETSQRIGEFLEWLQSKGIMFCKCTANLPPDEVDYIYNVVGFVPMQMDINKITAEYFDIYLSKLEQEKRAMLAEIRKMNKNLKKIVGE